MMSASIVIRERVGEGDTDTTKLPSPWKYVWMPCRLVIGLLEGCMMNAWLVPNRTTLSTRRCREPMGEGEAAARVRIDRKTVGNRIFGFYVQISDKKNEGCP